MDEIMKQNRISNDGPLCRFGPGGEYLYDWHASDYEYKIPVQDKLTRVLMTISDMIGDFVNQGPISVNRSQARETMPGELKYEKSGLFAADTSSASSIKSHQHVSEQQMLFSDDCGVVKANVHKPKHNIRAHRKPAKKRSSLCIAGQGTFFDDNFKSAKSA